MSLISPDALKYLGGSAPIKFASGDITWANLKDMPALTPLRAASLEKA
jgi:hypothetical protein